MLKLKTIRNVGPKTRQPDIFYLNKTILHDLWGNGKYFTLKCPNFILKFLSLRSIQLMKDFLSVLFLVDLCFSTIQIMNISFEFIKIFKLFSQNVPLFSQMYFGFFFKKNNSNCFVSTTFKLFEFLCHVIWFYDKYTDIYLAMIYWFHTLEFDRIPMWSLLSALYFIGLFFHLQRPR